MRTCSLVTSHCHFSLPLNFSHTKLLPVLQTHHVLLPSEWHVLVPEMPLFRPLAPLVLLPDSCMSFQSRENPSLQKSLLHGLGVGGWGNLSLALCASFSQHLHFIRNCLFICLCGPATREGPRLLTFVALSPSTYFFNKC